MEKSRVSPALAALLSFVAIILFTQLVAAQQGPTLLTPENNKNTNDNTPYFSWQRTYSDENYRIVICRDSNGEPNPSDNVYDNWLTENWDNFDTHPENALPDNLWWWGVRIENVPNDPTTTGDWTWYCLRVDTVAPVAPTLVSPADGENTKENKPTLIWWNVSENSRPVVYIIQVDNESTFTDALQLTVENWENTGNSYLTSLPELPDNLYYWRVRARDNAGNENVDAWSVVRTFRVDTLAPAAPIGLSAFPSGWTKHNSFTVSWTNPSDDSGISRAYYKLDSPPTSNTDGNYVSGAGITSIPRITVSGDGSHVIYVWLMDNAGNVDYNNRLSTTLYYDGTPPAGSVVIDAGATYATSTSVTLTLSASDATSGVSKMCFSNDGSTWTDWEDYSTSKSWTLSPGDGLKTVYVKFKDIAGNESSVCTDNIILDTTPPAPPTFSGPLANAPSTATGWSYTSTVSSLNLSGKVDPRYRVYLNDVALSVAADGSFTKTLTLVPGTNRFTLKIVDQAGNVTTRTLDVYYPGAPAAPSAAPAVPGSVLFAVCVIALIGAGVFLIVRLR
jgi:hypothetical protein